MTKLIGCFLGLAQTRHQYVSEPQFVLTQFKTVTNYRAVVLTIANYALFTNHSAKYHINATYIKHKNHIYEISRFPRGVVETLSLLEAYAAHVYIW
jgi:hypothetical protein